MSEQPFYKTPDEALKALRTFVDAMVTGSREHGAFGRGFRGEVGSQVTFSASLAAPNSGWRLLMHTPLPEGF